MSKLCTWVLPVDEYNWQTDCGHTYFRFATGFKQPDIEHTDKCPWCGKVREMVEEKEEEEEGYL